MKGHVLELARAAITRRAILMNEGSRLNGAYVREENEILRCKKLSMTSAWQCAEMLGPVKLRRLDEPIAVSLEALVPTNNVYRHLEAKLDLSFMRDRETGRGASAAILR